jgi:hypothetical protein
MNAREVRTSRNFNADVKVAGPDDIAITSVLQDNVELIFLDDTARAHRENLESKKIARRKPPWQGAAVRYAASHLRP